MDSVPFRGCRGDRPCRCFPDCERVNLCCMKPPVYEPSWAAAPASPSLYRVPGNSHTLSPSTLQGRMAPRAAPPRPCPQSLGSALLPSPPSNRTQSKVCFLLHFGLSLTLSQFPGLRISILFPSLQGWVPIARPPLLSKDLSTGPPQGLSDA